MGAGPSGTAECAPLGIEALAISHGLVFIGTSTGTLLVYPTTSCWPPAAPLARHTVLSGFAITQLQLLPGSGLILLACAGQIRAHSISTLSLVAEIHPSRALLFHSDCRQPLARLAVCAGYSLLWMYELSSRPKLEWSQKLPHRTLSVHLTERHLLAATTRHCFVLCTTSGTTLQQFAHPLESPLPPGKSSLPRAKWRAACFVTTDDPRRIQAIPLLTLAWCQHRLVTSLLHDRLTLMPPLPLLQLASSRSLSRALRFVLALPLSAITPTRTLTLKLTRTLALIPTFTLNRPS